MGRDGTRPSKERKASGKCGFLSTIRNQTAVLNKPPLYAMKVSDRKRAPVSRIILALVLLASTAGYVSALSRIFQVPRVWEISISHFHPEEGSDARTEPITNFNVQQSVARTTPAWLLNALPGYSSSRAREQWYSSLDRSGDRRDFEIPQANANPPVSDLHAVFNPNLFNNISPASFVGTSSQKTSSPTTVAANAQATWNGPVGGLWNVNANWSPNFAFPNGQGDSAFNAQGVTAVTVQNNPGGISLGRIIHSATTDTSWTIVAATPITLDQDGPGIFSTVIQNGDPNVGSSNALIITGPGGLVLTDSLLEIVNNGGSTNGSGSIQLNTPMSGTGNISFINYVSNNVNAGQIALLQPNSFTGTITITGGAVTFNDNSSFGVSSNVINLGSGSQASLVSSDAVSAMPNRINVSSVNGNLVTLGGKNATQTDYTGLITLNNNVTLTSASTVSGGAARTTAFTNTVSGAGAVTVTGTSSSVGFVELAGANTYLGGTTVSSGTLLVNNISNVTSGTGSGAVTVNNGGTLGGTGFINAGANDININSGGRITGGGNGAVATTGAVGTLTLAANTLTIAGTFLVDINGATADRLTLSGNLNLGSATDAISFTTLAAPTEPLYTLISYTGTLSGTFDSTSGLPAGYVIQYNSGEIDLVATPIPEPSTWIGAALALAAIGFRQRKRFAKRRA
jgi:autotransporter-associated beta strand protein